MSQTTMSKMFRLREGWLTVGLVALLLFSVIWSVQRAGWSDDLFILTPITLAGMVTALVLSKVRGVPRLLLHLTGTMAGIALILAEAATLLDDPRLLTIQDRVQDLLVRGFVWIKTLFDGGMSDDLPLFVLALAVLAWLLAYTATWFIFRSRALWWAIIPNALALLINLSYSAASLDFYFVLFVLTALVLMVQFNILQHEERWERERVNYSPGLRGNFLRVAGIFAIIVTLGMGVLPRPAANEVMNNAWNSVNGPWEALQDRWSNAFAGVAGSGTFGYSTFNDSFALGGSLNLGDSVAFRVTSAERLYWQAKTYDTFNGRGWATTAAQSFRGRSGPPSLVLEANQPLQIADTLRNSVTATVQIMHPRDNLIYTPLRPASIDIPARLDVSWQQLSSFYLIPGEEPNNAPIELRPLLSLLADARREALAVYGRTPAQPRDGGTPLPSGSPDAVARLVLSRTSKEGDINTQISQLRDRGIATSIALNPDFTFKVSAGGTVPEYDDLIALHSTTKMPINQVYTVEAQVSNASQEALRNAGREYPTWVRDRYLQIPPSLTPRVRELAHKIVDDAHAGNDYDRAAAIEAYLRKNYTYSTHITPAPAGRDYMDYFLFDGKEGYCEHYSTAMVMLLRVLSIPAREATGFAPGEPNTDQTQWTIRESSAHAWPEVYFPTAGWVQFEPTPSQLVVERPVGTEANGGTPGPFESPTPIARPTHDPNKNDPDGSPTPFGGGVATVGSDNGNSGLWALGVLAALLALAAALLVRDRVQRQAVASGRLVLGGVQYYDRLLRLAWWVGLRARPSDTPFEFAEGVSREVPGTRDLIGPIAQAYVQERYGRHQPDRAEQQQLARAWAGLRNRLLRRMAEARRLRNR
ncbi:MAG: DUF3488 and transglutaminase-like domain-containing protein [Chloroflexota bacterium]|nr:DUF3488 and transglutaminase-like domain-containing protein [Chloroflexota bacterium]